MDLARRRFDPAATAASMALGIVAWTAVAWPWTGRGLADALVNEWIIWFTAFYLLLVATTALSRRGQSIAEGPAPSEGARGQDDRTQHPTD